MGTSPYGSYGYNPEGVLEFLKIQGDLEKQLRFGIKEYLRILIVKTS